MYRRASWRRTTMKAYVCSRKAKLPWLFTAVGQPAFSCTATPSRCVFIPPWNAPGKQVVPVIGSETGFAVCETPKKAAAMRFLEFIAGKGFSILQRKRQNISPFKQVDCAMVSNPQIADYTNTVSRFPVTSSPYYSVLPSNSIERLHQLMQDVLFKKITPRQAAKLLDESVKNEAKMHYK